jgi:hypothetical protein
MFVRNTFCRPNVLFLSLLKALVSAPGLGARHPPVPIPADLLTRS